MATTLPLLLMLILGACGGGSTAQPSPSRPPASPTAGLWEQGVLVVGLRFNKPMTPTETAIPAPVTDFINHTLLAGSGRTVAPLVALPPSKDPDGIAPLVQLTHGAVAFYTLQTSSTNPDLSDSDLKTAVTAINNADLTAPVPMTNDTIWIAGASPDWGMLGAATSGGGIGGSPSGLPGKVSGKHSNGTVAQGQQCTSSANVGSPPATVYVLDTTDPMQPITAQSQPWTAHVQTNALGLCDGAARSVLNGICAKSANAACGDLLADLQTANSNTAAQETDGPLPDELAHLINYQYMGPLDLSFREHGMFIAEQIHHLAPHAQVNLLRTLNDFGGGDIRTLISRLEGILAASPTNLSGVVINLSLNVVPPPGCMSAALNSIAQGATAVTFTANYIRHCAGNAPLQRPANDRLYVDLGLTLDDLRDAGAQIVAAAGNDSFYDQSTSQETRFGADLPAAFCGSTASASAAGPLAGISNGDWHYPLSTSGNGLADFSNLPFVMDGKVHGGAGCLDVPNDFCSPQPGQSGASSCWECVVSANNGQQCDPCMAVATMTLTWGTSCTPCDSASASGCVPCTFDPHMPPTVNGQPVPNAPTCRPLEVYQPVREWMQPGQNSAYADGANICSLYLQFPGSMALWSGTSFATAALSGNMAANGGALPSSLNEQQPCS